MIVHIFLWTNEHAVTFYNQKISGATTKMLGRGIQDGWWGTDRNLWIIILCDSWSTKINLRRQWKKLLNGSITGEDLVTGITLNMGLTCSWCVALVKLAWQWLTLSMRAFAVWAMCSISTLYSSRLCLSDVMSSVKMNQCFVQYYLVITYINF